MNWKIVVFIIGAIGISAYFFVSNQMKKIADTKPLGPYRSCDSIRESKRKGAWIASYSPDRKFYKSADKSESYSFKEIWIESNSNNPHDFPIESGFEYILSIYFKTVTENDLHKFRLIGSPDNQVEHTDGFPRIRFLLKELRDTFRLEVIERNPKDSLNWATERVIDTVMIYKK